MRKVKLREVKYSRLRYGAEAGTAVVKTSGVREIELFILASTLISFVNLGKFLILLRLSLPICKDNNSIQFLQVLY